MGCGESKKEPITKNNVSFSAADKAIIKKKFDAFDTNKDGKMDKNEFKSMLKACGEKKTDNEIECMFYSLEQDDSGKIDFNGFLSLLDGRWDDSQFGKNLATNLFHEFDTNKTGFLDNAEFKKLVSKLESITQRDPSTQIELNQKFREIDANGNGKIAMAEVVKAVS